MHLQAIGHPIVGDKAYGGGGDAAKRLGLQRPFLHSWKIAFDQPLSGERIELEEPLPEDRDRVAARPAQTIEREARRPTCTLDDAPSRAYVHASGESHGCSYPQCG